jgi:hypothetical protein
LIVSNVQPTSRTSAMDLFQWSEPETGELAILIADFGGDVVSPAIGPVAQVTFYITPSATIGQVVDLLFTKTVLSDPESHSIPTESTDGMLIIGESSVLKGDANLDGEISVLDIVLIARYIIGEITLTPEQHNAADCNNDGDVNVLDMVGIANVILETGTCPPSTGTLRKASTSAVVGAASISIFSGRSFELPIFIETETRIAGLQFALGYDTNVFEAGMPRLTERSAHMSVISNSGNGQVICVVYSPDGMTIPDGNEPVLNIPFRILESGYQMSEGRFHFEEIILAASCTENIPVEVEAIRLKTDNVLPETWSLSQNYPNPFNPETYIDYQVPHTEYVEIAVFNPLGQKVRTLLDGVEQAGTYSVKWDGRDDSGQPVASGIYFYRLEAGNFSQTKRMVLLR